MEQNGTIFGAGLVLAFLAVSLFGVIYAVGIHKLPWLAKLRPAEQVVIGVLVTVGASGFVIGWVPALAVLILFGGSGLPMLIGSWIRAAQDDEEAKRIAREHIQ